MNSTRIIYRIIIPGLSMLTLLSCSNSSNRPLDTSIDSNEAEQNCTEPVQVNIFGVDTEKDECSVVKNLEVAGVLKIDSLMSDNGEFKSALVEFAGIKFGMNKGFFFITSRHDKEAISLIVNYISGFYGDPLIDGDIENAEYCYYHWNLYNRGPGTPHIWIRPLHTEEGGLIMMWKLD